MLAIVEIAEFHSFIHGELVPEIDKGLRGFRVGIVLHVFSLAHVKIVCECVDGVPASVVTLLRCEGSRLGDTDRFRLGAVGAFDISERSLVIVHLSLNQLPASGASGICQHLYF